MGAGINYPKVDPKNPLSEDETVGYLVSFASTTTDIRIAIGIYHLIGSLENTTNFYRLEPKLSPY